MAEARLIGESIGSYKVLKIIGQGGMGQVYLAEHPLIHKSVAIKLLLPQYSNDAEVVTRFFNEARAATLIKHPGIVEIFDFGHHPSGSAFIIMEYLEGESLAERLKRQKPLPFDLVAEMARQLASALGAAHQKGIVHRDLKPDNVFLVADPDLPMGVRCKVLDFGIAKLVGPNMNVSKTRTGMMMGTPQYMSPEQCRGSGTVDHRADIYSLGCMLFEMVTGAPPFVYDGVGEVIASHIFQPPPPLSERAPSLPANLKRVIEKSLAKLPDARYASVLDLLAELTPQSSARSSGPLPVTPPPALVPARTNTPDARTSVPMNVTTPMKAADDSQPPAPRRRWPMALAALALSAGAGFAVFQWMIPSTPAVVTPAPAMVEPVAAPEAAKVEAPKVEGPRIVHHAIKSQPSGAEVFRVADGARVGVTPLQLDGPASDGEMVLVLKLGGYADERVTLPAAKDGEAEAKLHKHTASASTSKKKLKGGVLDPFAN